MTSTSISLKRSRADGGEVEALAMANCLMLLSKVGQNGNTPGGRVYTCKTCSREFPSFQALGGHRASHKRPKLTSGDLLQAPGSPAKPKKHECSICGQEFAIGQALGGHMRRHRAPSSTAASSEEEKSKRSSQEEKAAAAAVPVMKRSSSKRVMCLNLDLNLTPYENGMMKFGERPRTLPHVPNWLIV